MLPVVPIWVRVPWILPVGLGRGVTGSPLLRGGFWAKCRIHYLLTVSRSSLIWPYLFTLTPARLHMQEAATQSVTNKYRKAQAQMEETELRASLAERRLGIGPSYGGSSLHLNSDGEPASSTLPNGRGTSLFGSGGGGFYGTLKAASRSGRSFTREASVLSLASEVSSPCLGRLSHTPHTHGLGQESGLLTTSRQHRLSRRSTTSSHQPSNRPTVVEAGSRMAPLHQTHKPYSQYSGGPLDDLPTWPDRTDESHHSLLPASSDFTL
ncbi:unnamed protein product [Protopolystoma xenopodis]|uniref:Uncharacterized protein n=1 Tax=Protopolystoma xenopodis TaxID=117903 RepID=A0A448XJ43_9PLAT|nr:unnamed protein product [Protopolystoma xenopodis]